MISENEWRQKTEMMQQKFKKDLEELKNKHLEELKNKQTEMTNTITEMKTTLEGINSRITEAEEWISDLEDKMVEFTAVEQNKEKREKTQINKIINERGDITSDNKEILRIIRNNYEKLHGNKLDILEEINSRITEAEERISDLENRMVEFTAAEQN